MSNQKLVLFTVDASKEPPFKVLDEELPGLRDLLGDGWKMDSASVAGYGQAGSRVAVTVLLSRALGEEGG